MRTPSNDCNLAITLENWSICHPEVQVVTVAELFDWVEVDLLIGRGQNAVNEEAYPIMPLLDGLRRYLGEKCDAVDLVYGGDTRPFLIRVRRNDDRSSEVSVLDQELVVVSHRSLEQTYRTVFTRLLSFLREAGVDPATMEEVGVHLELLTTGTNSSRETTVCGNTLAARSSHHVPEAD